MSHLPRAFSESESAAEDIRNALAIVVANSQLRFSGVAAGCVVLEPADVLAIRDRLERAARKLEEADRG